MFDAADTTEAADATLSMTLSVAPTPADVVSPAPDCIAHHHNH